MNALELAMQLNLNAYTREITPELESEAKDAGLVVVFGASDDLMEFRGAIYDEISCCGGGFALFDLNGLLISKCDDDNCPYFANLKSKALRIKAIWDDGVYSWCYETVIPHHTFLIMDNNEKYCRGLVFSIHDLQKILT